MELIFISFISLILIAIGERFLRKFKFQSFLEKICFSFGIGIISLSFFVFFMGLIGFLYRWLFIAIFMVIFFLFRKEIANLIFQAKTSLKLIELIEKPERTQIIFIWIIVLSGFFILINIYRPLKDYDSLVYILNIPKLFIEKHNIFDIKFLSQNYKPFNISMIYLFGLSALNENLAKLFCFSFTIFTCFSIYSLSKRFFSKEIGLYGVVFFILMPYVLVRSSLPDIVIGLTFFTFLTFYSYFIWKEAFDKKFLFLSGLFAGFCAGIDYIGIFTILILSLFVFFDLIISKIKRIDKFKVVSIFLLIIFIIGSPWYIRNYLLTQNPTYPYKISFFRYFIYQIDTPKDLEEIISYNPQSNNWPLLINIFRIKKFLARFVTLPFWASVEPRWEYSFGVLFVSIIPAVIFFKNIHRMVKTILIFVFLWIILAVIFNIYHYTHISKFMIPALSLLCIAGAYLFSKLLSFEKSARFILVSIICLSFIFNIFLYVEDTAWSLLSISGIVAEKQYLRDNFELAGTIDYANNELNASDKILFINLKKYDLPDLYYLKKEYSILNLFIADLPGQYIPKNKKVLKTILNTKGISYIALTKIADVNLDGKVVKTLNANPWIRELRLGKKEIDFFKLVFEDKKFYLYKVIL